MAARNGGARRIARRRIAPPVVAALLALTSLGAPPASATDPLPQEIAVSLPSSVQAGSTVTLEAAADSGLPVTLTSDTPETCAVEDGVLVGLAPGPCAVTATQPGDETFAAAPSVQLQTTIDPALAEPLPQVITFSLPSTILVGATIALDGTADSGLAVSYAADTPGTCSVAGSVLTAVAPGPCQVTASQAGDAVYAPAESVQASTTVDPQPPDPVAQTITFALPSSTLVGSSLVLGGTASSGLPVEYASTTPGVCSVSNVTLTALAVGTCGVTASQPGNDEYLPAANVAASMAVEAVPQGVDLGKYAVNGPVHDVVIEAETGRTFLGGDFTQIGVRTGPVAVVDPPDLGDGKLQPASPEVLGTVRYVFADDRPGDPGFFIVGELIAVNGATVPESPVTRMHLDPGANRWVVDTAWALDQSGEFCPSLARFGPWMATDDQLIVGGNTLAQNPVALWFVDRETGSCTPSIPGVDEPLPDLEACAGLDYCFGTVNRMDWDPATNALYVTYITWTGAASDAVKTTWFQTRYELEGGDWAWTTQLQAEPGGGFVTSMIVIGDRILLRGDFTLDAGGDENTRSHLIALNATTGAVTQRWNRFGAQQLVGGATLAAANECFTSELPRGELFDFEAGAGHWIGRDPALCQYSVSGGTVTGDTVDGVTLTDAQAYVAPTVEYSGGSGGPYLVGPWMAVALASGDVVDWHPEPSTTLASTSIAVSTAGVVIAGDFQFVRGDPAAGVTALTASLSPDPAFTSPLSGDPTPTVRALALDDGWLLVGGTYFLPSQPGSPDARSVIALNPRTGSLMDWAPSGVPMTVEAFAIDPDDGEFWLGGSSIGVWGGAGSSLLRFEAPAAGADPLPVPALTCLTAPILDGHDPTNPLCGIPGHDGTHVWSLAFDPGGRLYIAGAFGAADGSPRRGLARLDTSAHVDAWNADLLGAVPIPEGDGLSTLEPYSVAALGDHVIVGGMFMSIRGLVGGGGANTSISPLLVFSASTGQLVRPTNPEVSPWFPIGGWWSAGYDIVAQDSGVAVALGDTGVIVLNATTLDYDAGASAPFVTTDWWGRNSQNGIYALAAAQGASSSAAVASGRTASQSSRVVLAGSIPRWGNRVAGNVLASGIGNMAAPSASAPKVELRAGGSLSGTAVPIKLSWTASKGAGVALDHYVLENSTNGGGWSTVSATIKSPSFSTSTASSGTVRFRVRAVNQNGIESSSATGPTLSGHLSQQTSSAISYHGTWRTASSSSYSGGSTRYTRTSGAKATYTFTGRSVAFVTTKSPTRGKVKVYVNGSYVTTVDLYASAARYRTVAWQKTWTTSAKRTVTLVAAGPSSRPRIDLDAFAYVK